MFAPEYFNTVVPLGTVSEAGVFRAAGAGVLVAWGEVSWLVTAAHVIDSASDPEAGERDLAAIGTAKSGEQFPIPINEILRKNGIWWIRSGPEIDLAAAPVPLSPDWLLRSIPAELMAEADSVQPGMTGYTVGVPYGLATLDPEHIAPLVLDGVICGTDQQRDAIYTSAPTFPGNSGGPFFVHRSPFNLAGGLTVGKPTVFLAGIVLQQMLVNRPGPTVGPVTPSLHLGVVRGVRSMKDLLKSERAQTTVKKIRTED